jgi:uncharacterized membrane protein YbhN (UPF0104 family)
MVENTTPQRKITIRKVITYLLQITVFGLLAFYLYQNRDVLISLKNIRWQHVVWVIALDVLMFLINSYINYLMIRRLEPRISFIDCFMLQYVNNLLNKILPTIGGGAAYRAYYLKRKYQFPYTQFASTVAGLYVISFSTTALIGILCLLIIYTQFQVFNWVIFLAFLGILAPCIFVILFSPKIPSSDKRLLRILKNVVESWGEIKKDYRFVLYYGLLSVVLLLFAALYTYIGYVALGVSTTFVPMIYLSTLGIIMAFLNFTPDGIGVKEGIYIFSQELVRIPDDVLVLGSLYLRGISIVTTFLVGGLSYWILSRNLQSIDVNSAPATEK